MILGLTDVMRIDFDQHNLFDLSPADCPSIDSELTSTFSSFQNLDNSQSAEKLRVYIKDKAAQGDYEIAISLLDKLIALCPDNATDYNNRGLMHFRNDQIIEALCDLSQALEINPQLDSAYNNRANCYAAQGDLSDAIADYDLALDLNPGNLKAWINQGITFRELGMYNLAIENFDIALIIGNSLQDKIYTERGRAYHLRGDWNCAVADYHTALEILEQKPSMAKYEKKISAWLGQLLDPLIVH